MGPDPRAARHEAQDGDSEDPFRQGLRGSYEVAIQIKLPVDDLPEIASQAEDQPNRVSEAHNA